MHRIFVQVAVGSEALLESTLSVSCLLAVDLSRSFSLHDTDPLAHLCPFDTDARRSIVQGHVRRASAAAPKSGALPPGKGAAGAGRGRPRGEGSEEGLGGVEGR